MTNVEFLIVGNGLAGTLLAFEMLERNLDFRIMASPDRSRSSMVAAGMFNPMVFKRMTKSWMADELLPVMKRKYTELEQLLDKKFLFEKDILKPLSRQELLLWKERKLNNEFAHYIKSVDNNFQFKNIKNVDGYGIVTKSGYINISAFLNSSESFFRKNNHFFNDTFSFETYRSSSKLYKTGEFIFNKIVLCEGYHMAVNPFFNHLPLKPVKGELLEIHSPDLSEEFIINRRVFVLPVGNHRFKVGSTYDWQDISETPTQEGKETIISRLDELIAVNYVIINHWAGIRPTISDRRPVLGKHPVFNNLFLFNGLGTKGVMLAPYMALEMVSYLTEQNFILPKEVQIERFE